MRGANKPYSKMQTAKRKQTRLEFYYTDLEWTIAEVNAKKEGYKSLIHYLTKRISEMDNDIDISKDSLEEKIKSKRRKYYPTIPSCEILERISNKAGVSPVVLVSRLLINPLLKK